MCTGCLGLCDVDGLLLFIIKLRQLYVQTDRREGGKGKVTTYIKLQICLLFFLLSISNVIILYLLVLPWCYFQMQVTSVHWLDFYTLLHCLEQPVMESFSVIMLC